MINQIIPYIPITIELVIAVLGLMIALKKKKILGLGIFVTFALYVFYDYANLSRLNLAAEVMYSVFLIATLSALWFVWMIYKSKK